MAPELSAGQISMEQWQRLGAHPGLCRACAHARLLASARSVFLRCGLSDREPGFPRYPPLPVRACAGYQPVADLPA